MSHILLWFYSLFGLGYVALMCLLFSDSWEENASFIPGLFAMGTLTIWLLMIVFPIGDAQITPSSMPTLPLATKDMFISTVVGSFVQSRGLLVVFCSVTTSVILSLFMPTLTVGIILGIIVGALLGILTTVIGLCMITVVLGSDSKESKDRTAKYGVIIFLAIVFGFNLMMQTNDSERWVVGFGSVVQWIPGFSSGGIIAQAVRGSVVGMVGTTVISVVGLGILLALLWGALRRQAEEPLVRKSVRKRVKTVASDVVNPQALLLPGLGWRTWSIVGSTATRQFFKDSRTASVVWILPIFAAFVGMSSYNNGDYSFLGFYSIFMAVIIGSQATNVFGLDGPGAGLVLSSSVSRRAWLVGRMMPIYLLEILLIILMSALIVVLGAMMGELDSRFLLLLIAVVLLTLGAALSSIAIGFFMSAYNPYPTARPGTNPLKDRSGFKGAALLTVFISLFVSAIPLIPGIVCFLLSFTLNTGIWLWILGCVVTVGIPVLVHLFSLTIAARRVNSHGAEIYQKVKSWVNG